VGEVKQLFGVLCLCYIGRGDKTFADEIIGVCTAAAAKVCDTRKGLVGVLWSRGWG
jgi:hypothetical protein